MKTQIKKATAKDLDDILRLAGLMLAFHHKLDKYYTIYSKYEDPKDFYKHMLGKKNTRFVLVKDENGNAIGFGQASIISIPRTRAPKIGKLISIFIKEEYRKQKIGTAVFNNLMQWFKKEKVKYIELHVDARNKKGLAMWKKLGFKNYQINLKMDL